VQEDGTFRSPGSGPAVNPDARLVSRRYGEVQAGAFAATYARIVGSDLSARAWGGVGGLQASWVSLHEPESPSLRQLDLLRFDAVGAFIALGRVEGHVLMGVDVLHGNAWTPAFGAGLEVRAYPVTRLTVDVSSYASVFGTGSPLFESRLEVGVALGRVDLRAGMRWWFQQLSETTNTSLLGPSVSALLRLGP
jgi:hypothetical protein